MILVQNGTSYRTSLWAAALLFAMLAVVAGHAKAQNALPQYVLDEFGAPPEVPSGAPSARLSAALDRLTQINLDQAGWTPSDTDNFLVLLEEADPRAAWLLSDMMRFTWQQEFGLHLTATLLQLTGIDREKVRDRADIIDHLIAWDMPAYPGYLEHKRTIFTNYIPGWERLFREGDIDWHLVDWGGVYIDARPFGRTDEPCNCIPAADNPPVTSAPEAGWLDDGDIVFGIALNGEARAYPRQIMEVREMVNDTLGGRDLGIPYCTLCGAAQAFFTDGMPAGTKRPVLRTSGLLSRSNKVMYDLNTYSVFDTFLGTALTGPLATRGIQLEQATVITTSWGEWKAAYPETTVLAEYLALGRDFDFRNGRDANGPIFPVGDVDPRLPVQEDVIGVTTASGAPIAFQRSAAVLTLSAGQEVAFENVRLRLDAGGVRAEDASGADLGSHQAFWFAWSQFHPGTKLWAGN